MTAVLNIQRLLEAAEYIERRERGTWCLMVINHFYNTAPVVSFRSTCVLNCMWCLKGHGPILMCDQRCDTFLRCLFQSVNTDMPRPFRLFSTPAIRDKGNSEIKSATTTTTGKHMIWLYFHKKGKNYWRKVMCIQDHTVMTSVRTDHCIIRPWIIAAVFSSICFLNLLLIPSLVPCLKAV